MTKLKIILILFIILVINHSVSGQLSNIQIINYRPNDPFVLEWDCVTVNKYLLKSKKLVNFNFSNELPQLSIDSLSKKSNYSFYCRVEINSKINSLIFLEKNTPDTTYGFQDDLYKFHIHNFNQNCSLLSSCTIHIYERSSDGLSFYGLETSLTFKNNLIIVNEIHEMKPLDLIVRFKITEDTFKTREEHIIQLDNDGFLSQIK